MAQRATDQLVGALQDFRDSLTSRQSQDFFTDHSGAPAKANAVSEFVAHIDLSSQRRPFRCLAGRMQGALRSVEQFSKTVDTFVPSRPPVGPQVWGTLRFTIDLASNYSSFFEILSDWFIEVQPYCPKLGEYEFIHKDSFRLQEALCSFHAILVDFCTHAVRTIGQCGVAQHGKGFWTPLKKDFEDYAALLQKRYQDFQDEIVLAIDQATQRDRQLQVAEKQKADEASRYPRVLRLKFDRLVEEDRVWKRQVQLRNAKSRREGLLDRLSDHDSMSPFHRERKKRYGCTAVWLPRSRQFQDWITDNEPSTFWLSGLPGSGKTVMATAVIDSLLLRKGAEAVGVSCFFCQYNKAETLKARTLLGSLIRQCLVEENLPASHETYLDQILSHEPLNVEDTKAFFLKVLSEASEEQVLVVDGFDEMIHDQRSVVLDVLRHISGSADARVKVFISSRHDVGKEIEQALPKLINRSMSCQSVVKDVATYIKLAIAEKVQLDILKVGDNALLPIVEEILVEKSNGNFLWAFFQIEELCAQSSDDDIYKLLASLPKDLPDTFRQALRRILRNKKEGIAAMMFFWAAAARRPLALLEMREVIAIHDGQRALKQSQLVTNVDSMVSWCGGLLELDEQELVVRFTHYTVRDYLFSVSEDPKLACFHFHIDRIDWDAGKACCTYLSLDDFIMPTVAQPLRPQNPVETNGARDSSPKAKISAIARSKSTLDKIRKVRPSSIVNILQIMEEPYDEPEANEKPAAPIQKPKRHHYFLSYAREYWLHHTATIRKDDGHYKAWKSLVFAKDDIAPKPWTWKSRSWAEPEDPELMNIIIDLNHGALLDLVLDMHAAQTHHLNKSPKFHSILHFIAQRGSLSLFYRLLDWDSSISFSLWTDTFDAAIAGGQVPIIDLLLRPDSWESEPLRFSSRGTRPDINLDSALTNANDAARDHIAQVKENLKHTGPLAGLKLLMEIEAKKEGTAVGFVELLEACKAKDEPYVERILATGVDPRGFPGDEYGAIREVMKEEGEL